MKKTMFNDKFSLTEAVLSGRKTQTRRIINLSLENLEAGEKFTPERIFFQDDVWKFELDGKVYLLPRENLPKYKVGEVVAVAQSYKDIVERIAKKGYDAAKWMDVHRITKNLAGWLNKMFVKASLMIFKIRITNVRAERLKDISDEDCIKEGICVSATDNRIGHPFSIPFIYYIGEDKKGSRYSTPREAYAALIDRVSGKGTWERNPYVFVYDFELVK